MSEISVLAFLICLLNPSLGLSGIMGRILKGCLQMFDFMSLVGGMCSVPGGSYQEAERSGQPDCGSHVTLSLDLFTKQHRPQTTDFVLGR